jgi:hypothetical protein
MNLKEWCNQLSQLLWRHRLFDQPVVDFLQRHPAEPKNGTYYAGLLGVYARHKVPWTFVQPLLAEIKAKKLLDEQPVLTGLLHWYCTKGDWDAARLIAERLGPDLDIEGRTSLIRCCRDPEQALKIFHQSPIKDLWIYNAILQALLRSQCWDDVSNIIVKLRGEGLQPDLVTLKILFKSLVVQQKHIEAKDLLQSHVLASANLEAHDLYELHKWTHNQDLKQRLREAMTDKFPGNRLASFLNSPSTE